MARKRKKVSDKLERPCWVNHADAWLLFDLLQEARPKHPLLGRLDQILHELEDQAEQLRDMVKAAKAQGFFEKELSNVGEVMEALREGQRQRRKKLEDQVAHLEAIEVKEHVIKLQTRDRRGKKLKGGIGE
jgi:hypothetical protein